MELEKTVDGQVAVLRCVGRLNMVAAPRLRATIEQAVADGQSRVVVDLSGVTFVDSSGLGSLIGGLKVARTAGGDLRIAGPPEQVMTVLKLTNLDRILGAHLTVADAAREW
ncbi:Anti-anti-sigma regulatory factor (Antagonist of anti-sigma factor) [metagenome]|uniref:Anti-anti-sigma regulatory factor (Antagonist of anti-sigma factor) n=1 Tax=metagenome TaxID=256318 RepID=A0A2P2C182_9ZZZZ